MSTLPLPLRMRELITAYWNSMAIYAAAKLKLADHLVDGPKKSDELAPITGVLAHPLYRLMRALASLGIFREDGDGRFHQTPLSECLRSDSSSSLQALAVMNGEEHYRGWGEIMYSLQTGKPAFDHIYGKGVFEHLAENPESARTFDAAMVGVHGVETPAMLEAYDFSSIGTLADVGGGNGSLLIATLQRHPNLKGMLSDLPHVIERAKVNVANAGLTGRCQLVPGSFFNSVPPGADAYLMRHIIHDWDDDRSLTILTNIRKVIPAHGKLLLVEGVVPADNEPSFTKMLDLTMLVLPGGMERTEAEYRGLYQKAGFDLTRIVPTRSEISVIEGCPV